MGDRLASCVTLATFYNATKMPNNMTMETMTITPLDSSTVRNSIVKSMRRSSLAKVSSARYCHHHKMITRHLDDVSRLARATALVLPISKFLRSQTRDAHRMRK